MRLLDTGAKDGRFCREQATRRQRRVDVEADTDERAVGGPTIDTVCLGAGCTLECFQETSRRGVMGCTACLCSGHPRTGLYKALHIIRRGTFRTRLSRCTTGARMGRTRGQWEDLGGPSAEIKGGQLAPSATGLCGLPLSPHVRDAQPRSASLSSPVTSEEESVRGGAASCWIMCAWSCLAPMSHDLRIPYHCQPVGLCRAGSQATRSR